MERYRTLIAAAALLGLAGSGCIHIHLDGEAKDKLSTELLPAGAMQSKAKTDSAVKPASALFPGGATTLPKMMGSTGGAKNQAVEMSAAWQNRVAYLPDPTRDGAMGAGLVGQLFLFGSNMKIATPEGPLTIELFDETPHAGRPPESVKLGRWTIDKETLKKFRLHDERWGPCYALFLPWPDYRADIVRIRLTVKYEPEGGFPIYATPSTITLDTSAPGSNTSQPIVNTVVPGMQGGFGQMNAPMPSTMSPIGGPPPANFPQHNGMGSMSNGFPPGGMGVHAAPQPAFTPPPSNPAPPQPAFTPPPSNFAPQQPAFTPPPASAPTQGAYSPTTYVIPAVGPQPSAPMPPSGPMQPMAPMQPTQPIGSNVPPPPLPIPTPMNGPGLSGAPAGLQPIAFTTGPRR